jgi:hypothetical protein
MPIIDLYSKQKMRERGEVPDVFAYDEIPDALRVQIIHILWDALGPRDSEGLARGDYEAIVSALCREYGVFKLSKGTRPQEILSNFILLESNLERVLDAVQLAFTSIESTDEEYRRYAGIKIPPQEAIKELNGRFLEHAVGYEYISRGKILKKDSEILHTEVVKPILALLQDSRYQGANDEFLKAHDYYRKGEIKDCLVYSLKALESTLKTICNIRGWTFKPTDTAKTLF